MNEENQQPIIEYDSDKMSYYVKNRIIGDFIQLIKKYDYGIYALAEDPISLECLFIDAVPKEIVEEYHEIRSRFENDLKGLINKIEELPVNPL